MMMALSMWQPWASLFLSPAKEHETRPWEMRYRGWLAIHAAKRRPGEVPIMLRGIAELHLGMGWLGQIPFGSIIGAVYIEDCVPTEQAAVGGTDFHCGDYSPGRFAIKRGPYFTLDKPIPAIGRQRYFYLSDEIDRALEDIVISRGLPDAAQIAEARHAVDTMSLRGA